MKRRVIFAICPKTRPSWDRAGQWTVDDVLWSCMVADDKDTSELLRDVKVLFCVQVAEEQAKMSGRVPLELEASEEEFDRWWSLRVFDDVEDDLQDVFRSLERSRRIPTDVKERLRQRF